jgi:RimJ/RimL family protein N-acetyltransferase
MHVTNAPESIETARLLLTRPRATDADAIFTRYASDPDVTRYVGWPRHRTVDDNRGFLAFSDAHWQQWPAGPYLAWSRSHGTLLGSTGLAFEAPDRAATGYVFATDAWGRGYASEALAAMVDLSRSLSVRRLYALVHVDHRPSARVLEKCGFAREAVWPRHAEFPNLMPGEPQDVACYVLDLTP